MTNQREVVLICKNVTQENQQVQAFGFASQIKIPFILVVIFY